MTQELTPELRALFPSYVATYTAKCLKTVDPLEDFDHEFAINATRELYRVAGLARPEHIFIGTWQECIDEARRVQLAVAKALDPAATFEQIRDLSGALSWGQMSAAAAAFARFFVDELGTENLRERADTITAVTDASGPTLLFGEAAFMSYHPTSIDEDPNNKGQLMCSWEQPTGLKGWMAGNVDTLIADCIAEKRAKKTGKTAKKR
jgi:hypothetical protein